MRVASPEPQRTVLTQRHRVVGASDDPHDGVEICRHLRLTVGGIAPSLHLTCREHGERVRRAGRDLARTDDTRRHAALSAHVRTPALHRARRGQRHRVREARSDLHDRADIGRHADLTVGVSAPRRDRAVPPQHKRVRTAPSRLSHTENPTRRRGGLPPPIVTPGGDLGLREHRATHATHRRERESMRPCLSEMRILCLGHAKSRPSCAKCPNGR